ncbi:hypothetical protein [Fischerella thermalis]
MEMNDEPPRRQERQELSFSTKGENKIIPLSLQRLFYIQSVLLMT